MEIDWSKAPEGATHYNEHDATAPWRKVDTGGTAYWWTGAEWVRVKGKGYRAGYIAIPNDSAPQWDGTGLPPVGTVCEVVSPGYTNKRFERFIGEVVTIVAHDQIDGDPVAVFRMPINGDETEQDYHALIAKCFRPLRTPEQIAAEEREKAVIDMAWLTPWPDADSTKTICAALYDAGYRKQA